MKDKLKVVPDGQLEDVKKCNVDKCLNVFKNRTDAEGHDRIFHADPRLRKRIAEMFGYVCGFKSPDGSICEESFSSIHYLRKHRVAQYHPGKRRNVGN